MLAFLGVFAALATLLHNNTMLRSQITEAYLILEDFKKPIHAFVLNNNRLPNGKEIDETVSLYARSDLISAFGYQHLSPKTAVFSAVLNTLSNRFYPAIDVPSLTLKAHINKKGDLTWRCGTGKAIDTHINYRYLPVHCRNAF